MSRSDFRRFLRLSATLATLNHQLRNARALRAYVVSARAMRSASRITRLLRR